MLCTVHVAINLRLQTRFTKNPPELKEYANVPSVKQYVATFQGRGIMIIGSLLWFERDVHVCVCLVV